MKGAWCVIGRSKNMKVFHDFLLTSALLAPTSAIFTDFVNMNMILENGPQVAPNVPIDTRNTFSVNVDKISKFGLFGLSDDLIL